MAIDPNLAAQAKAQEEQQKQNGGLDGVETVFDTADVALSVRGISASRSTATPASSDVGTTVADAAQAADTAASAAVEAGGGIGDALGGVGDAVGGALEGIGSALSVFDGL